MKRRHYVSYELIAMCFIGHDKKTYLFFALRFHGIWIKVFKTHKKQTSSV